MLLVNDIDNNNSNNHNDNDNHDDDDNSNNGGNDGDEDDVDLICLIPEISLHCCTLNGSTHRMLFELKQKLKLKAYIVINIICNKHANKFSVCVRYVICIGVCPVILVSVQHVICM